MNLIIQKSAESSKGKIMKIIGEKFDTKEKINKDNEELGAWTKEMMIRKH